MDNTSLYSVSGMAENDYIAKKADELSFTKGAIITHIKEQQGGWCEGTYNGKTGLFPDSYVKMLHESSGVVLRDKSATLNRRCKAVYSYTQNNDDELSLAVGDVIEFLEEVSDEPVEEGWWRGKLKNKVGVFPSNFVIDIEPQPILSFERVTQHKETQIKKHLSSSKENLMSTTTTTTSNIIAEKDAPILPPKPIREVCKVLFPYEPANEDELELITGDIITILTKELPDKGWWKGELKGKVGVFPDNFVQIVSYDASPSKDSPGSKPDRPPLSSKILINKSPNAMTNSTRKDSFGSKDSLNETTGIIVGNVAAHRMSLENRTVTTDGGLIIEKSVRKSIESKINPDLRKSLENLDDNRKSTPPPVLTKKPVVPIKKSPTISSVTGNLFGFKPKPKASEHKTLSLDNFDGMSSSKMNSHIPDNVDKGVIGERISKRDDSEFDHVERGNILSDMRAGRAKAPKRRPPSAAVNIIGGDTYMNGNNHSNDNLSESPPTQSTDEEVAKPKPREWEKHKAPWMAELKANQMKKTSPNTIEAKSPEPHKTIETAGSVDHVIDHAKSNDLTKSLHNSYAISNRKSSNETNNIFEVRSSSIDVKTNYEKRDMESSMTKSMSSVGSNLLSGSTKISIIENTTVEEKMHPQPHSQPHPQPQPQAQPQQPLAQQQLPTSRPLSVNLRNRSISPISRSVKSIHAASVDINKLSNHDATPVSHDNVCSRVCDLEQRVMKLEIIVQTQTATIDDLVKTLKDEKDKVKVLKTELDKYAQCVTQV